ncbi:hypothetical protein EIK77_005224 [Talaromyces pinophilus]|nr:hypothetical protein EIK77_005224 [Talaromyces pinophilus]
MWTRIKGLRRKTNLQTLLSEKTATVAIAQFFIDTGLLAQFNNADPEAMGTYGTPENEEDTDLGKSTAAQAGDVNARSAHSPIRTNNRTSTSQGPIPENEPVDEDAQSEPGDVEDVQLGELSFVWDERARIRAIDLWD